MVHAQVAGAGGDVDGAAAEVRLRVAGDAARLPAGARVVRVAPVAEQRRPCRPRAAVARRRPRRGRRASTATANAAASTLRAKSGSATAVARASGSSLIGDAADVGREHPQQGLVEGDGGRGIGAGARGAGGRRTAAGSMRPGRGTTVPTRSARRPESASTGAEPQPASTSAIASATVTGRAAIAGSSPSRQLPAHHRETIVGRRDHEPEALPERGLGGARRVRLRPDLRVGLDRRKPARREVVAHRARPASPRARARAPSAVDAMQVITAGRGESGRRG